MRFEEFYGRIKAVQEAMVFTGIALNSRLDKRGSYTDAVEDVLGRTMVRRYRPGGAWRTEK